MIEAPTLEAVSNAALDAAAGEAERAYLISLRAAYYAAVICGDEPGAERINDLGTALFGRLCHGNDRADWLKQQ